jgi:hypothetical protein
MPATFYCDESGNTGVHWADPDQPVFTHGGWLIPAEGEPAILQALADLKARHRLLQAPELKWQQLARRSDPSAIFRDVFRTMLENGSLPFFMVMDKDYLTAAKVVETFFDPAYNTAFPMAFTADYDTKKEIAEAVLQSPAVLREFSAMLRAGEPPTHDALRALASDLADHLRAGNAPVMADTLLHFSGDALSDIQGELSVDVWMRTTFGHSLPALIQVLEGFLRTREVTLEIVHDNVVRFEAAFDIVQRMFRRSDGKDFTVIGERIRFHTMPTVTGLRLADSMSEPMIQLADLLCGFVRTLFTKIKRGEILSADELAVCGELLVINNEWFTWDGNMPVRMWTAFVERAVSELKGGRREPHAWDRLIAL